MKIIKLIVKVGHIMNGQSNNNDLQKAIDEITGGVTPPTPPMAGAGVPEMPTVGAADAASDASAADVSASDAGASDVGASDVAPIPTIEPVAGPAAEAKPASAGGDLAKVRESALQELVPLMDKVDITSQEKFDIYAEVIESTKDKSIVEKAFEAARSIDDEKVKAESLLKLVQMIDSF